MGYVFEETRDRASGFLVEPVQGRVPGLADLEACSKALRKLHRVLVHCDINKHHIIVAPDGPIFIDFEMSTAVAGAPNDALEQEVASLDAALVDESGTGASSHDRTRSNKDITSSC